MSRNASVECLDAFNGVIVGSAVKLETPGSNTRRQGIEVKMFRHTCVYCKVHSVGAD
jgi:hypothetical protein